MLRYNTYLMKFIKTTSIDPVADYLASVIISKLSAEKKVLWLLSGGSAIQIATHTAESLKTCDNLSNLSISLVDERYGLPGYEESNWQQLLDDGTQLQGANLYPVLKGANIQETTDDFEASLKELLVNNDYRIGLFGMGPDGHIASLFPNFPQLEEQERLAVSVDNSPKPPPERITLTIPAIEKLDEAILFVRGEEKRPLLDKLQGDMPINEQPAQILKRLPKLTVFNDQVGEKS